MAVPIKGWLVNPRRWSVKNILNLAEIGEYYKEGKDVHFKSSDPEIEVIPVRASDVPYFLNASLFDIGITGTDLIREGDTSDSNLEYICDLGCRFCKFKR